MSETEELKKNTENSYRVQVYKELNAYLDSLSAEIDEALKRDREGLWVYTGCWLVWIASSVLDAYGLFYHLGLVGFFFGWGYSNYRSRVLSRALGKWRGAMDVLEILGIVSKRPPTVNRKKRKSISEFFDTVKNWAIKKKQAQDKVYAPA